MFSRLEPEHEGERLLAVENGVARRDQRLETHRTGHRPLDQIPTTARASAIGIPAVVNALNARWC